jgi:maltose O-acetyltransferase
MISDFRLYVCNFIIAYIPFHAIRISYYKYVMGFEIGQGSSIHLGCVFNCKGNFKIGLNSTINQFCRIDNRGGIYIGNNVSISPYAKLITADHDLYNPECYGREKPIIIKDYCFIGSDAMILPGVTMEKGAALAAKSLLHENAKSDSIYVGIPATPRKNRGGIYTYSASYKRWFH